jgi:preprotein translocase subunit SecA
MWGSRKPPGFGAFLQEVEARKSLVSRCADRELRESAAALRHRLSLGEDPTRCLPEAFSTVSVAALRTTGVAVSDSQMIAGMVAFCGSIAELRDGEGKGIAAILAAYLAALSGARVHVVTLDAYLARRDFVRARAILELLGIDTRLTGNLGAVDAQKNKYGDVTYGSYTSFVCDYLEDNLAVAAADRVQGVRDLAIVDEADTILIDESRSSVQIVADADGRRRSFVHCAPTSSPAPPVAVKTILAGCLVRDYFRTYGKLAGLTATARPAAPEFKHFYGLDVIAVPVSAADSRTDRYDLWYGGINAKISYLIKYAVERHNGGQPVLIRAKSTDEATEISERLTRLGLAHAVLRSSEDVDTARVMAGVGTLGAVTIVVSTAGRGYGVWLGGDVGYAAEQQLRAHQSREDGGLPGMYSDELQEARKVAAGTFDAERRQVIRAGGLVVLGTSRSGSARVDDWLRGLAGQRGEPGESQFYMANEDFSVHFNSERRLGEKVQSRGPWVLGRSPFGRFLRSNVSDVYRRSEAEAFEYRREMADFDDLADSQRQKAYALRQSFLENASSDEIIRGFVDEVVSECASERGAGPLRDALEAVYPVGVTAAQLEQALEVQRPGKFSSRLAEMLRADLRAAYERRQQELGPAAMQDLARRNGLLVFDQRWRDHLVQMHDLYRRIPQGDASIEKIAAADFHRRAAELFNEMIICIRKDMITRLFQ